MVVIGIFVMKIGVLSDTHLTEVTPEFARVIETHFGDADAIIHAGDTVAYNIYSYLQQFSLYAVAGNMDSPILKELLDNKVLFRVNNVRIGVMHGNGILSPVDKNIVREFPGADVIVYGHTHRPLIRRESNGTLIFNPGSFRGNSPDYPPSIGLLHIDGENEVRAEIVYLRG